MGLPDALLPYMPAASEPSLPQSGGVIPTGALLFPNERGLLFMAAAG